jgi:hypothetical protein
MAVSESGLPVLAAMGVPWILRGTVASLKIVTDAYLRVAAAPTALELREAGAVLHGSAWECPGVWCTLDRTAYGDSRSIFLLDGACRKRMGADGKPIYARAWQVGVPRGVLGETGGLADRSGEVAWTTDGLDVAGPGTITVLNDSPDGAIVTESVISASVGEILVVETRHPIEGGRKALSAVSVFKPVDGATGGSEGYGAGEYKAEPEASQRRVVDNLGFDERESARTEANKAAQSILDRHHAAITQAAAAAAASPGPERPSGAASRLDDGSPAVRERRGSDASGSTSSPSGRARSSARSSSGAAGPAGRVSTALDRMDLSGQWRVDPGRSQPLGRVVMGMTTKLAAALQPRLVTPTSGKLRVHHTAWQLRLQQTTSAGACVYDCALLLDGSWHAVSHGPGGKGAPYLPVKATQEASGLVSIETRLSLLAKKPVDESKPPPAGPSLHEAISQGGRGRSSVNHAITLVTEGGEVVGDAARVMLREETAEERILAQSLLRRRAEEEAERARMAEEAAAATAAAEATTSTGIGSDGDAGAAASGEDTAGRMRRGTREGMETLLQSAVKDFFGTRASVSLVDGKAVLSLPARDEREAAEMRMQGWRRSIGQAGLLTGVIAFAMIVAMMPSLNKFEAVAVMACGMIVYAVGACMPCIQNRGLSGRSSIVRRAQERMEAGDEEGATEALLAEAAARALQMTMAERASRVAAEAEPAPTLPASDAADMPSMDTAARGGLDQDVRVSAAAGPGLRRRAQAVASTRDSVSDPEASDRA